MVRRFRVLFALLCVLFVFGGCEGASKGYQIISQEEAVAQMKDSDNYVILDVRTREEYDQGHIPDAVLMPVDTIRDGITGNLTDKSQALYLYCRTGRRAEDAAKLLAEEGFENIFVMGGILEWKGEVVTD